MKYLLIGMWLLLSPPDEFQSAWIIVGAAPSQWECEKRRATRPDGRFLICADTV